MENKVKFDISIWAIVKVCLVGLSIYILFLIKDIIALFFVVLLLTAAFRPVVNSWEKKVGRLVAVLILFFLFLLFVTLTVYLIIPPVINQTTDLIAGIPDIFNRYEFLKKYVPEIKQAIGSITNNIGNITGEFVNLTANIVGSFIAFFTAIIMTIYLLLEKDSFSSFVKSVIPSDQREVVINVVRKITVKVGDWFRGQLFLGFVIGVVSYIGLLIIGAPYAITLALISGILEIVPTIGPLIAGLTAVLVTLVDSPVKALFVLILYVVIQQLENTLLVPKVMQKAVGLSPVVIILAILIGGNLLGVIGAVLAVPVAASIAVIVQEWSTVRETIKKNA